MALAAGLSAALAIFIGAGGGTVADAPPPKDAGFRLQRFGSCDQLVSYASEATARLISDSSGLLPSPPLFPRATQFESRRRGGLDYSTTNVQEAGIDEPDLVKTDGRHLFVPMSGRLHAVAVVGRPRLAGTLELGNGIHELLLRGKRLLVLTRSYTRYRPFPGSPRYVLPDEGLSTVLTEVDVASPARMRVLRTLTIEGHYVTARLHAGAVRVIVSSSMPRGLALQFGQVAENRALVRSAPLAHWLPYYELKGGDGSVKRRYLVQCRHVWRPPTFSGLGLLTVLTIDLDRGLEPANTVSLFGDGRIVYASPASLYVAAERWTDRPLTGLARPGRGAKTVIHKFGIASPFRTRYRASGFVPGFLLSQWSLSEHEGVLRVASTDTPIELDARRTASGVSTLAERNGRLVHLARIGGIGRGERLYAVRFIGEVGYVVTFRQVDPLYTLDLSTPERPRLLGELTIPGWSSYLHPVGKNLLLGIGQDTDPREGRSLQLSVFDISNLRRPARLHHRVVGPGQAFAEDDHHAFLYWPPSRLAVIPAYLAGGQRSFAGALGVRLGRRSGIDEVGKITHPGANAVLRTVVVGDSLYTVSDGGVDERGLRSFGRRGWVAFPRTS
jgi:hypothetical protein